MSIQEKLTVPESSNESKTNHPAGKPVDRSVRIWLLVGVILVFFQIFIGGVTRLTDSGLSITEWEVIQGTLPPMSAEAWDEAFDKYKMAARKQFETLHADMTLSEFKVIYFWEYFHRLWARMMGIVFIIPFTIFLYQKRIPRWMVKRLFVVIGLASLAAVFGWIMVKSGLNDDTRTWVSAYKLIIHLAIATTLISYLFWTFLLATYGRPGSGKGNLKFRNVRRLSLVVLGVLLVQILFGGLMAGMRAGLIHPHFPFFIEADYFYNALGNVQEVKEGKVIDYEPAVFAKAWVQALHRIFAYLLVGICIWFVVKLSEIDYLNLRIRVGKYVLITMLGIQFLLGVLTVINSIGSIPVIYGVIHQSVAIILLGTLLYLIFQLNVTFKLTKS